MIALLAAFAQCRTPIVLVPGAFRSRLNITTTRRAAWYCPKQLSDERAWIRILYFMPPFLRCFLDWMTVDMDDTTKSLRNRDNVSIYPDDFGGVSGIAGTGPSFFGRTLPPYFSFIIERLESHGYTPRRDLFGAPYDWRFGASQPESYFTSLKELVEKAFDANGNEKVTIIAHSLGCQITNRFLTEKTTVEWREKYINRTVFVAPSWSGSGTSFNTLWRIQTPFMSLLKLNQITQFARSLGTLHIHIPHTLGYKNETLFVDPEGNEVAGDKLIETLEKYGKMDERSMEMAQNNYQFVRRWPTAPDVQLSILYNSGIRTPLGLNLTNWKGFGQQIYGKGDGLVGARVIDWVCENWNVKCHDMNSSKRKYMHKNLLFSDDTIDIIVEWALGVKPKAKETKWPFEIPPWKSNKEL